MSHAKLALGPLLYDWPRQSPLAFYADRVDAPVDIVYLGETVCSRRHELRLSDWLDVAAACADAGKEVVLSRQVLVESESDLKTLRRIITNGRFRVEANDMGAVHLLTGDEPRAARRGLERVGHRGGALEALVCALREGAVEDALEPAGLGREARDRDGRILQHPLHRVDVVAAPKETLRGQRLPEHDAHGEDVQAPIDGLVAEVLRRHVSDLALQLALGGRVAFLVELGDTEVHDPREAVDPHQDVLRRDVAVHEPDVTATIVAEVVGGLQAGERVKANTHRERRREPRATLLRAGEELGQRGALDVVHHQRDLVTADLHVADVDHVRVADRRGQRGLGEQLRAELGVVEQVRVRLLDGDELAEAHAPAHGANPHGGHPPRSELQERRVARLARRTCRVRCVTSCWSHDSTSLPERAGQPDSRPLRARAGDETERDAGRLLG